ncbi:MAG TPA: type VII secretion protein EccCa [Ktedonobacterales bacterium]|jgi:S-DNA-T family DNA segregation ATPase FtsK/SpoIIIE
MYGKTYHLPARKYPDPLPTAEVVIGEPPSVQTLNQGASSWVQLLVPVLGSAASIGFILLVPNKSPLIFIMAGGMVLLTIGSSLLMRQQQRGAFKAARKHERQQYQDHLAAQSRLLDDIATRQRATNALLYPTLPALEQWVNRRERVWERRASDGDFLRVRLGVGPGPLACNVSLQRGNNWTQDYNKELLAKAQALVAKYGQIDNVPMTIDLRAQGTLACGGRRPAVRALLRSVLTQLAVFQSPDDLRILAYYPPGASDEWAWLKWLPHSRRLRPPKGARHWDSELLAMLATSPSEFRDLLTDQIQPEIDRRRKIGDNKGRDTPAVAKQQHLVLILDDFRPDSPVATLPLVDELMRQPTALDVTVICLVDGRDAEPGAVRARVTISDAGWVAYEQTAQNGLRLQGATPDAAEVGLCERIARGLAPLTLGEKGSQRDLAEDIRLLDLLSIHSAADIMRDQAWRPRTRQNLLKVPVGVRADGEPLLMDFREAAEGGMGPHGLIIGATGSGKSELLRTIVTSLALTHDPDTVNFVLVDFKGGAAFADLATLPHCAGLLTNLESDLTLVDRMQDSLRGEGARRDRLFRAAGNLKDIREYHHLRAQNPTMEPLPYLMVVIDEFAELLAKRPDFKEVFDSIGRVGRSQGIHLLLASQRLEEGRIQGLESALRYRMCLRTNNTNESQTVLGAPDAFYLPSTPGLGYFKVDNNVYDLFKTALISSPYVPVAAQDTDTVRLREFTPVGRLVACQPPGATPASGAASATSAPAPGDLRTEMDVVIDQLASDAGGPPLRPVHMVCLPPLGNTLTLAAVLRASGQPALNGGHWPAQPPFGSLIVPMGLVDIPAEQAQIPLALDFSGIEGHLAIVGAPRSGKSTLLAAILAGFLVTHTPRDAQFYCVDLGGGLLKSFEGAPHVGAVCGRLERDKVRRLIRRVSTVIEERELLFQQRGIDSMVTYRARRQAGQLSDVPFGDVFLVIDDVAQFRQEFDQLDMDLVNIVNTGLAYGVHVLVSASRWVGIPSRILDNIGGRLELRLTDAADSQVGKAAAAGLPPDTPGRGLLSANKGGLAFQCALPAVEGDLDQLIARAAAAWAGPPAPAIKLLPDIVTLGDLPAPGRSSQPPHAGIPIGLEEFQLDPIFLDFIAGGPHFLVFGDGGCGKTAFLRALLTQLAARYTPQDVQCYLVDYRRALLPYADHPLVAGYSVSAPMLKDCLDRLKPILDSRLPASSTLSVKDLSQLGRWDGPHQFLFIDDYEVVVPTPQASPLAPLMDSLLQARDTGLHVVLARSVGGANATFDPFVRRLREMNTPGLVMSGDPQENALIGTQRAAPLPPGRGYLVQRNQRTTLVQMVYVQP